MSTHALDTPERRAFYARIDKDNMTALWTVMGALITPEPKSACVPFLWKFADIRAAMIEAGGLITAKEAERRVLVLENPGLARPVESHDIALCRRADGLARRSRAGTPPFAIGVALRARRLGRAYRRQRRAHAHGGRRLRHHAVGAWHDHGNATADPMFWLDGLDIPLVQFLDASFVEHLEGRRAADRAAGGRCARALRRQHAAGRSHTTAARRRRSSTIPMRARARRWSRCDARRPGILPRPQDEIHQPGDGRSRHADHGHVPAVAAEGIHVGALPLDRRDGIHRRRRARPHAHRRHRCRMGPQGPVRRAELEADRPRGKQRTRCCSPSRIGQCRKNSASGAKTAATRDVDLTIERLRCAT